MTQRVPFNTGDWAGPGGLRYSRDPKSQPTGMFFDRNMGRARKWTNSDYELTDQDGILFVDTSGGDVNISVPAYFRYRDYDEFTVIKISSDGNALKLKTSANAPSDTLNGGPTVADVTAQYKGWNVACMFDSSGLSGNPDGSGYGVWIAWATG